MKFIRNPRAVRTERAASILLEKPKSLASLGAALALATCLVNVPRLSAQSFKPMLNEKETRASMMFLSDPGELVSTNSGVGITYIAYAYDRKLLPLSFYSTPAYWGDYVGNLPGNDLTVKDIYNPHDYTQTPSPHSPGATLQVERVAASKGINIYDGACWQIALGIYGFHSPNEKASFAGQSFLDLADNETLLLSRGYDGRDMNRPLNANRALTKDDGTFTYNGKPIADPVQAFFFRMIPQAWVATDPLLNTPYKKYLSLDAPPNRANHGLGRMTWLDWKPITGENAWAFLIGPIHLERLKAATKGSLYTVPFTSAAMQNAVSSLTAFAAMQSPVGGIYYACKGTTGNQGDQKVDPYAVSIENNASALAGMLILKQTLQEEYRSEFSPEQKQKIAQAIAQVEVILDGGMTPNGYKTEGMISFFKKYAWNKQQGNFLASGVANRPNSPAWIPDTETKAVDTGTWTASVLGQPFIDKNFGFGSAYKLWQDIKSWGAYYGSDGTLWGVGYSDHDNNGKGSDYRLGINSGEWTAGAINYLRCMISQYRKVTGENVALANQYADDMRKDHDSMVKGLMTLRTDIYPTVNAYSLVRPANYTTLIPIPSDRIAFLYASKRYLIPFGWYSNPIPSTTSTAWAIMLQYNFNPFSPKGTYEAFLK